MSWLTWFGSMFMEMISETAAIIHERADELWEHWNPVPEEEDEETDDPDPGESVPIYEVPNVIPLRGKAAAN